MDRATVLPRLVEPRLAEALDDGPVVPIHGPRQSGKTTLAQRVGGQRDCAYFHLDDDADDPTIRKAGALLKELFQLDQPDLDFGFYRVMHARSAEVTQFLDKDLLPQVKAAFAQYQAADKAAIEKGLADLRAAVQKAGMDPAQSPKVQELERQLADDAVDLDALEAEVYDHLYTFFRRYYSEGDFHSKRAHPPVA